MAKVLTSWKGISQYMGKGVRTLQRWESQYGLPVRRPQAVGHRAVLAIAEELDTWAMSQRSLISPIGDLRLEVLRLQAENAILRGFIIEVIDEINAKIRSNPKLISLLGAKPYKGAPPVKSPGAAIYPRQRGPVPLPRPAAVKD